MEHKGARRISTGQSQAMAINAISSMEMVKLNVLLLKRTHIRKNLVEKEMCWTCPV